MVRAYLTTQQITVEPVTETTYCDNLPYITRHLTPNITISLEFEAVQDEYGVIYRELQNGTD